MKIFLWWLVSFVVVVDAEVFPFNVEQSEEGYDNYNNQIKWTVMPYLPYQNHTDIVIGTEVVLLCSVSYSPTTEDAGNVTLLQITGSLRRSTGIPEYDFVLRLPNKTITHLDHLNPLEEVTLEYVLTLDPTSTEAREGIVLELILAYEVASVTNNTTRDEVTLVKTTVSLVEKLNDGHHSGKDFFEFNSLNTSTAAAVANYYYPLFDVITAICLTLLLMPILFVMFRLRKKSDDDYCRTTNSSSRPRRGGGRRQQRPLAVDQEEWLSKDVLSGLINKRR